MYINIYIYIYMCVYIYIIDLNNVIYVIYSGGKIRVI